MTTDRSHDYLDGLVNELRNQPRETEWVEFKVDCFEISHTVGEYVSASL